MVVTFLKEQSKDPSFLRVTSESVFLCSLLHLRSGSNNNVSPCHADAGSIFALYCKRPLQNGILMATFQQSGLCRHKPWRNDWISHSLCLYKLLQQVQPQRTKWFSSSALWHTQIKNPGFHRDLLFIQLKRGHRRSWIALLFQFIFLWWLGTQ